MKPTQNYKFIDLFAGIGGFHYAFHREGFEYVFASEIDSQARLTYEHNFKKYLQIYFKKEFLETV